MSLALRLSVPGRFLGVCSLPCLPSRAYGRTAAYRRITSRAYDTNTDLCLSFSKNFASYPIRIQSPNLFSRRTTTSIQAFSTATSQFQEQRQSEEVRDPPRQESDGKYGRNDSSSSKSGNSSEESDKSSEEAGKQDGKEEQEKKKDSPPPPPHGNKSPWQVFTETLQSEFKASKEWNESTKAIASSAHQFSENESVKRARAAYNAASGAATSTTANTLRSTGKVLGQGAAWTWETPVVKGLRSGVNATGRGIEKATKPVRETQVYKTAVGGVKDVIDDGSSSRYGGWMEKEERRKQKELRESQGSGRHGRKMEKMEEDPK